MTLEGALTFHATHLPNTLRITRPLANTPRRRRSPPRGHRLLPELARGIGDVTRTALLLGAALWERVRARRLRGTPARAGRGRGRSRSGRRAALLFDARRSLWRAFVGVTGLLVGAWPLLAALSGEFYPGPFTSVHWTATAISFGVWYLLLGTALLRGHMPVAAKELAVA